MSNGRRVGKYRDDEPKGPGRATQLTLRAELKGHVALRRQDLLLARRQPWIALHAAIAETAS